MLPACSAPLAQPLIALLVAGEDEVRSWRELVVGYITISIIIINIPIHWAWVEGLDFCSVFCSTHATLGADKPALCSLILRSLHDGWMGTP